MYNAVLNRIKKIAALEVYFTFAFDLTDWLNQHVKPHG
jgi:hypothetical protein